MQPSSYDCCKISWCLPRFVLDMNGYEYHRISIPYGRQSQTTKKLAQKTNKSNNNSLMDLPNEEELHSTGDRNLHIRNLRQFSLKRPLNSFSHHSHTFTKLTKLTKFTAPLGRSQELQGSQGSQEEVFTKCSEWSRQGTLLWCFHRSPYCKQSQPSAENAGLITKIHEKEGAKKWFRSRNHRLCGETAERAALMPRDPHHATRKICFLLSSNSCQSISKT